MLLIFIAFKARLAYNEAQLQIASQLIDTMNEVGTHAGENLLLLCS